MAFQTKVMAHVFREAFNPKGIRLYHMTTAMLELTTRWFLQHVRFVIKQNDPAGRENTLFTAAIALGW
jgi:hypothetical protein